MPAPFHFDRAFDFGLTPEELWSLIERTDRYVDWWGWLRACDLAGEVSGLRPGVVAHCVVRGPIPYLLRFSVRVERVVRPELVVTEVAGDLEGRARLEVSPRAGGCRARLVWTVWARDPALRVAAVVARPLLLWGHDWVVSRGVEEFRRRAIPDPALC